MAITDSTKYDCLLSIQRLEKRAFSEFYQGCANLDSIGDNAILFYWFQQQKFISLLFPKLIKLYYLAFHTFTDVL